MLSTIKNMIKEQKAFLETAEILLENDELDDSIVLGEDTEFDEEDEVYPGIEDKDTDEEDIEGKDDDDKEPEPPEDDGLEKPIEDDKVDDLPEPIGAQTGEPAQLDNSDLLNVEVDPATNTQTDTLPIPPVNATDAIDGDADSVHADSGFGGNDMMDEPMEDSADPDESDDILDTKLEETEMYPGIEDAKTAKKDIEDEECDGAACEDADGCSGNNCPEEDTDSDVDGSAAEEVTEAITVGNVPKDDKPADDEQADDTTTDDAAADEGNVEDEPADDNLVTSAVKDKVSEINSDDAADTGDTDGAVKDVLFKKLSGLTKSLEDVKKVVMDKISG